MCVRAYKYFSWKVFVHISFYGVSTTFTSSLPFFSKLLLWCLAAEWVWNFCCGVLHIKLKVFIPNYGSEAEILRLE
jgi:hypothetical protein